MSSLGLEKEPYKYPEDKERFLAGIRFLKQAILSRDATPEWKAQKAREDFAA